MEASRRSFPTFMWNRLLGRIVHHGLQVPAVSLRGTAALGRQAVWSEGLGRGRLGLVVRWIVLSDGAAAPR